MSPTSPNLDRFVAAVRRRLLVAGALEHAGLGALAGSILGGVLILLMLWRDQSALAPTVGAIVVGSLVGLLWSLTHRPTAHAAAAEADRQLGLSDLLATAVTVASRPRESDNAAGAEPWLRTVLAAADAACRRHAPADVILRRLDARAWGGIALSAALAVTLAGLTTQSPRAVAHSGHRAEISLHTPARPLPASPAERAAAMLVDSQKAGRSVGSSDPTSGPERAPDPAESRTTDAPESAADAATPRRASPGGASDPGTGDGSARAAASPPPQSPTPSRGAPATIDDTHTPRGPLAAGGSGRASTTAPHSGPSAPSGTSGTVSTAPPPPPWQTDTWPADARRAAAALDTGQVPPSHRDLVRQYFDRP